MQVIKRDGRKESFDISKLRSAINYACEGLDVNPLELESKFSNSLNKNIHSKDIQKQLILNSSSLASAESPDWIMVSGRLLIYDISRIVYKNTSISYDTDFSEVVDYMTKNGYYDKSILKYYTKEEISALTKYIIKHNDKNFSIGAADSLVNKYLIKNAKGVIELPQHADMAIALYLNKDIKTNRQQEIIEDYKMISNKYVSIATPFKANLRKSSGNLSSCFIMSVDDNLESLNKAFSDAGRISKEGGGLGIYLSNIRPSQSMHRGRPVANNITKWVKIFNDIAVAVNQSGIRAGAFTVAVDVWYKDLMEFIEVKTEVGELRDKSFDIFPQVVVNDIFIQKVKEDGDWYLLDQTEVKKKLNIDILIPKELEKNFKIIEDAVKSKKLTNCHIKKAKEIWKRMLEVYITTGDFYIVSKDNMNKSNPVYQNGYYIQSANLCLTGDTMIDILTSDEHYKRVRIDSITPEDIESGIKVLSYCPVTDRVEFQKVIEWLDNGERDDLYEIETFSGKKIICTGNHKIYIENDDENFYEYKTAEELYALFSTEMPLKLLINKKEYQHTTKEEIRFMAKLDSKKQVYDINVENNHNFFANDVLVHNCVESFSPIDFSKDIETYEEDGLIIQKAKPGYYHCCNLISLNMAEILNDQKLLEKACRRSVRMLDKSIEATKPPVIEAKLHNEYFRTIGIGLVGAADWMAYNKYSYKKEEHILEFEKLIETIAYYIFDESANLAQEYGSFKKFDESSFKDGIILGKTADELTKQSVAGLDWKSLCEKAKNGMRNMLTMAIAPNTSCQCKYNKIQTNDGVTDIETILLNQGFDIEEIERQEPHWINLKEPIKIPTRHGESVVNRIYWNGFQQYVEIEFEDGSIHKFTYNHKLLMTYDMKTELSWQECQYLSGNEKFLVNGKLIGIKSIKKNFLETIATYDFEVEKYHEYLLENGIVSHNTSTLMNASASYLPVFNKFNYEIKKDSVVPVAARFLKTRFWFYNEAFTVPAHEIIKLTNRIQKWIDTGISMELVINPSITNIKKISDALLEGFSDNLKALYYSRTLTISDDGQMHIGDKEVTCSSCAN